MPLVGGSDQTGGNKGEAGVHKCARKEKLACTRFVWVERVMKRYVSEDRTYRTEQNRTEQNRTKIADRTMMATSASNDNQPPPRRHNNTVAHTTNGRKNVTKLHKTY